MVTSSIEFENSRSLSKMPRKLSKLFAESVNSFQTKLTSLARGGNLKFVKVFQKFDAEKSVSKLENGGDFVC